MKKEDYVKAVEEVTKAMAEGSREREEEWEDSEEFKEYFIKNYDMFIPIVEAMVDEDGFSMREAVMFIYGYGIGRGSMMELFNLGEPSETSH